MVAMTTDRLFFTGDEEADRLLVASPLALLIGFALDQQVTVQKAFSGPLEIQRRMGSLDAAKIGEVGEDGLISVFSEKPSIHRFPANMAKRVYALIQHINDQYGGDAAKVWTEAKDGKDLEKRLSGLPGFGEMKVKSMIAVLGKQLGAAPAGWESAAPNWPTLGDVDSPEALANYQGWKRAGKAEARETGKTFDPAKSGKP
jgi:uncharacterized HhH-GPD family protein